MLPDWHELTIDRYVKIQNVFSSAAYMQEAWSEAHRKFHTLEHLFDILKKIKSSKFSAEEKEILTLAAYFHDVIYDPRASDNEEKCESLVLKICKHPEKPTVAEIVRATKTHEKTNSELINFFLECDSAILYSKNAQELFDYEEKILKEYQFVDYSIYKQKRCEFLRLAAKQVNNSHLLALADYVENRNLKVGLLAGSFNPFHIGHYNILSKAEEIFDKVIVCSGINPEKIDVLSTDQSKLEQILKDRRESLEKILPYHQVYTFAHSIPKLLETFKDYNVTVVKGLRGSKDFEEENLQRAYIEDIVKNYSVVYIPAYRSVEHVSSSGLRFLTHEGKNDQKAAEWAQMYVCDVFEKHPINSLA